MFFFYGLLIAISGVITVIWPGRKARAAQQRIAEGTDNFFEEQRAYRAYPSLSAPKRIRWQGVVAIACGMVVMVASVLKPD